MRQEPGKSPKNALPMQRDELQAPTAMPADVREAVVDLLSEILVLDYQLFQGVSGPTVKMGSGCNRNKLRLVKPRQ